MKNDKNDSIRIAKIAYTHVLKVSLIPPNFVLNLRTLFREYFYFKDDRTSHVNKLHKELRVVFPAYNKTFSDITGKTSLELLKTRCV